MSTKIQMNQTQETKSEMLITCNQILKWPLDNQKKNLNSSNSKIMLQKNKVKSKYTKEKSIKQKSLTKNQMSLKNRNKDP